MVAYSNPDPPGRWKEGMPGEDDDLTVFAFFGLDMLYEKPKKKNLGGLVKSAPLGEKDKQAR